jgi:hypothetical protein
LLIKLFNSVYTPEESFLQLGWYAMNDELETALLQRRFNGFHLQAVCPASVDQDFFRQSDWVRSHPACGGCGHEIRNILFQGSFFIKVWPVSYKGI